FLGELSGVVREEPGIDLGAVVVATIVGTDEKGVGIDLVGDDAGAVTKRERLGEGHAAIEGGAGDTRGVEVVKRKGGNGVVVAVLAVVAADLEVVAVGAVVHAVVDGVELG